MLAARGERETARSPREAKAVLIDRAERATVEAVVSLTTGRRHVLGTGRRRRGQPPLTFEELLEVEQVVPRAPGVPGGAAQARRHRPRAGLGRSLVGRRLRGRDGVRRPAPDPRARLGQGRARRTTTATPTRSRTSSSSSTCTRWRSSRVEDHGVVPVPPGDRQLRAGRRRPAADRPQADRDHASRRGRASRSTARSSAGRSGGSGSASPRARGWSCTPSARRTAAACGRSSTAPRSPRWSCPTATRT